MKTVKIGTIGNTNLGKKLKEKRHLEHLAVIAAEEAKLNETFKRVAKSIYPTRTFVSVYDVSESPSMNDRILLYRDYLSRAVGDWAPWSSSYKKH